MTVSYKVQQNDTPGTIAAKFTRRPERMAELVTANPQKKIVAVDGRKTFADMHVGEQLRLPNGWAHQGGLQGLGSIGLGDCTPTPGIDITTAMTNLNALLTAGTLACGGPTYTSVQQVCDFQAAYQAWAPTATPPQALIPADSSGASYNDGELGPNTITAINAYLTSIGAGYNVACGSNGMLTQVTPGTVTPVTPTTPTTPTVPTTPTTPTTTTTTSSSTTIIVTGLALAAAVGAYWWLRHDGAAKTGAAVKKGAGHVKRLHAAHRSRARRRR
jgi:hypothetical protein